MCGSVTSRRRTTIPNARKTVDTILRSYGIVAGTDFQMEVLRRQVPSDIYTLNP